MRPSDYQQLLQAIDRALSQFDGKPLEKGFDFDLYEELLRVRESLIRSHRDLRDQNVRRDSKSPTGQT